MIKDIYQLKIEEEYQLNYLGSFDKTGDVASRTESKKTQ